MLFSLIRELWILRKEKKLLKKRKPVYSIELPDRPILDLCCGAKMFYTDKNNPLVLFCDNRELSTELCDGRKFEIKPDVVCDFTHAFHKKNSFDLVIFDPPHLYRCGDKSWLAKKYGKLKDSWERDLTLGFANAWQSLKVGGTLVFKWSETDIQLSYMLNLFGRQPIIKYQNKNTFFCVFYKDR